MQTKLCRRSAQPGDITFYGSERVVERYNLMGSVKAALESVMRYVAAELGPKGIRAHAISPGPIRTRATSDVGNLATFLVSDAAERITGTIIPVDWRAHLAG